LEHQFTYEAGAEVQEYKDQAQSKARGRKSSLSIEGIKKPTCLIPA